MADSTIFSNTEPQAVDSTIELNTKAYHLQKSEVGEVRPSQLMTTFGIGSLVDLPNLSVIVMGQDDWNINYSTEIAEERLLRAAQSVAGSQVVRLLSAPRGTDTQDRFSSESLIGVPVAPFPRWLICTKCRLLAPINSGLFEPKNDKFHPDKVRYVHSCTTQGQHPLAVPARFMTVCEHGHLDDFPWLEFVHGEKSDCKGKLYLYEVGASGEAVDVELECKKCGKKVRMGKAFEQNAPMPQCRGRRPHLRDTEPDGCDKKLRPMLQGASNIWFPVLISVLSIPQAVDDLDRLIEENWAVLEKATSIDVLKAFRSIGQLKDFNKYDDEKLWNAVAKKLNGIIDETVSPSDLKTPEWNVFSHPNQFKESRTFKLRQAQSPPDYEQYFDKIVLVEKLREVRAILGFTRITSPQDFDNVSDISAAERSPISRHASVWLPASETRGEGIFLQFSEHKVQSWVNANQAYENECEQSYRNWRISKKLDPDIGYPGIRYVLLHTFAHTIIRQLAIECGYTSASIAERIYSRNPSDGEPMAGVLIYTAAPDSEGTLGGLCNLGTPINLNRHVRNAIEKIRLCASDPLCAEHKMGNEKRHGAACHTCLFLPETSCERGNKFLDRSVLSPTMERSDIAFF